MYKSCARDNFIEEGKDTGIDAWALRSKGLNFFLKRSRICLSAFSGRKKYIL